jgi:long-chain acyl-CoA synthetase
MFQARVRLTPEREAYRQFDPVAEKWISHSWSDMQARVWQWRASLRQENLPEGARIAILLPNCIEHVCLDQAALSLGLVPVPLHVVDNPESLAFILGDCGASLLLVDSAERWAALEPLRARFPALQRVLYLAGSRIDTTDSLAQPVTRWLQAPGGSQAEANLAMPADPEALAAIVYTSGTTGRPKGVMLSHRNVISNLNSIAKATPLIEGDVFLSFLPLSHTLERTVGYYLPIAAGATVAFARSVQQLMADIRTIRPTVLVSVPRIYERAHTILHAQIDGSTVSRRLFDAAVRIGYRRFEHQQGRAPALPLLFRAALPILDFLVGRRVRAQFGGRLRVAVTGGAAMAREVSQPLLALGLPLLQGYGMTESAPVIASNTPRDNDPSTVGHALPDIEVRIGEQDELLTRSASVMRGYWHRPEDTARVIDADGWLHTGDQAEIVDGRIRIKGRIKDIIVTSTGEKVAPVDVESAIAGDSLFEQALVLGEQRSFLAAIVVLNREKWKTRAAQLGLDPQDIAQLRSSAATCWVLERIAQLVRGFPSYSTPRAVLLCTEPWTVANGLLTPTLKPKRTAIAARYAEEIAALYKGH